jgi:hypothetical protein
VVVFGVINPLWDRRTIAARSDPAPYPTDFDVAVGVAEAIYLVGDLGKAFAEALEFTARLVVAELAAVHLHQMADGGQRLHDRGDSRSQIGGRVTDAELRNGVETGHVLAG